MEQAGVTPEEALHVGDHLDADVQGARSLGIGAVLIDRRGRFDTGDVPPDVPLIRSLDELLPLVDARRSAERLESA
jgi:putative hydrolase of the HAD superfamily